MTEQEWHDKNNDEINKAVWARDWTAIRKLFKATWHDGYLNGWKNANDEKTK